MKIFGIVCFSGLSALLVTSLNFLTGNGFIFEFIRNQTVQIATTIIGFNIAVQTILIGQIGTIEASISHLGFFKNTRKELKENAICSLSLLCLIFTLLNLFIKENGYLFNLLTQTWVANINFGVEILVLMCLIVMFWLLYDTIQAVYKTYDFKQKK